MRNLIRNKTTFYHARVAGSEPVLEEPILDEDGFETGEYTIREVVAKPIRGHIARAVGESITAIFGSIGDYDIPILLPSAVKRKEIEIVEGDRLWIDIEYTPTTPHNYVVKRITRSINQTWLLCSRVINGQVG